MVKIHHAVKIPGVMTLDALSCGGHEKGASKISRSGHLIRPTNAELYREQCLLMTTNCETCVRTQASHTVMKSTGS